jgi:hypothetical protein
MGCDFIFLVQDAERPFSPSQTEFGNEKSIPLSATKISGILTSPPQKAPESLHDIIMADKAQQGIEWFFS